MQIKKPSMFYRLKICPASMSHKRRVEWTVKDWIRKLDRKFLVDERKIALSLATVKFIPSFLTWQTFNLFSCPQTPRQFFSKWTKVSLEALKRITQGQFCVCYAETWRKWALSKYFIFTSNEDTCWFLEDYNKGNCYQLSRESWNQIDIQKAAIADSDNQFNPFSTNVPLIYKPDSWFLLAKCLL